MIISEVIDSKDKGILVYHGGSHYRPHDGMYFSTSEEFAESYGQVYRYSVNLGRMFDSLNEKLVSPMLPLYDPYDDEEIYSMEEYMERSNDTWEIIEQHLSYIRGLGYDSIRIFEGGVENYYIFRKENIRLVSKELST